MDNEPAVTKSEMKSALTEMKLELTADMKAEMKTHKDELEEFMRQIETNILTAFHGYARGVSVHFHTLDAAHHDVNIRMALLEDRVMALETRRPSS